MALSQSAVARAPRRDPCRATAPTSPRVTALVDQELIDLEATQAIGAARGLRSWRFGSRRSSSGRLGRATSSSPRTRRRRWHAALAPSAARSIRAGGASAPTRVGNHEGLRAPPGRHAVKEIKRGHDVVVAAATSWPSLGVSTTRSSSGRPDASCPETTSFGLRRSRSGADAGASSCSARRRRRAAAMRSPRIAGRRAEGQSADRQRRIRTGQ
jgi:hypothetical protein